jgi:hypothetical protein
MNCTKYTRIGTPNCMPMGYFIDIWRAIYLMWSKMVLLTIIIIINDESYYYSIGKKNDQWNYRKYQMTINEIMETNIKLDRAWKSRIYRNYEIKGGELEYTQQ